MNWINESVYKETHPKVLLSNVKQWTVLFNKSKAAVFENVKKRLGRRFCSNINLIVNYWVDFFA